MPNLQKLSKMLGPAGKALVASAGPAMFEGLFTEFLKSQQMSVAKVSQWVQTDTSLWGLLSEDQQRSVRKWSRDFGGVPWLTCDWIVKALTSEFSDVASLILNWDEAHAWLEEQVDEWQAELKS